MAEPTARLIKAEAARWKVITPWQRGEEITEAVLADITSFDGEVSIRMIGSARTISLPVARAKLLAEALTQAVAFQESSS
jgi:hypothetical protein